MELDNSLTNEDLQDLHEDILDRNEDGVRSLLNEFRDQGVLLKKLCCTEVELEPAPTDHVMNRGPLTAIHRAALIDSHGILDAILTSLDDVDVDLALERSRHTPLHVACSAGVLAAVNYLTSSGASLVARDAEGRTPMHMAAENGHKDVLSLLCVRGASVIAHTCTDRTPLHLAATSGHPDVVDFLLSKGADPNVKDKDGRTPLHDAQARGSPEVSYALIERGADVNAADGNGRTPMHIWILNKGSRDKECRAEYDGSFPALAALMNCGAEVNLGDQNGDTALHLAADTGDVRLTEFLLNQRASVSVLNNVGRTALFCAKSPGVASLLIQFGSEVNLRDSRRNTALHVYASSDDVTTDVVEVAIRKGAEVDAQNCEGQTALHCACAAGNQCKIELLLRSGARHDVMDRRGQAALHVTLSRGEPSLALWLLERIADVTDLDNQDKDGNTLLHLAARSGNAEVVHFLTSRGVALSLSNKSKQTPATLAAQCRRLDCLRHILLGGGTMDPERGAAVLLAYVNLGDEQMVERLLDQNVDCNAEKDEHGRTALHVAIERELIRISIALLDHGADVSLPDNAGQCPLHVATRHLPALEALLSRLVDSSLCDVTDRSGNAPLHYAMPGCRADTLTMLVRSGCRLIRKNDAGKTPPHCLLDSLSRTPPESAVPEAETLAKLDFACVECPECLDQRDNDGDSLLHAAIRTANVRILNTLLGNSPCIDVFNKRHLTPLHCACANGYSKMASLLLEHGADVDVTDADGRSPIFDAVLSRDTDLVLRLLRHGADVNRRDVNGMTCLMVAMETRQSGMCEEVLFETAPDVALVDNRGRSLLHYAARHCSRNVVEILLDQSADVSVRDASSMTPLHAASANDDDGVMASLLSCDVDVDARDEHGNTALHLSAERGSYSHVKRLLDRRADPEIANDVGRTAAHLAATVNDADVIELLIANEADIDVTDDEGNTPLALSIARGNVEISSDLLDQGADVTIRNASGDTVLHHAVRMSELDRKLLKLLVRRCGGCLEAANSSGQTPLDILKSRTDLDLDGIAMDMGLE